MELYQYALIAFLIEAIGNLLFTIYVHDVAKPWYDRIQWKQLGSIVIGVFVAFGFGIDLLRELGFTGAAPWMGTSLTGLLLSRGSNFINDLTQFVKNLRKNAEPTLAPPLAITPRSGLASSFIPDNRKE